MSPFLKILKATLFVFVAFSALAPSVAADVLTVGTDGPCDFAELQDAIDAAWDGAFIRVQAGRHGQDLSFQVHDKSLTVTGGYEKCWGEQSGTSTLFVRDDEVVLSIRSLGKRSKVRLSHIEITGAEPEAPFEAVAGGVSISGEVDVEMDQVEIHHTSRGLGGGISIWALAIGASERRPTLALQNSRIYLSRALLLGGGISCRQADIAITNSSIDWNIAPTGAGAALSRCRLFLDSSRGPLRLQNNRAERAGGGLSLTDSQLITTTGKDGRMSFEAIGNLSLGSGGAIHMTANSRLEANGFYFKENIAGSDGGAIAAWDSELELGKSLGSCGFSEGCQSLVSNYARQEGGALFLRDSKASIDLTMARANIARNEGGAFAAVLQGSELSLTNVVLTENRGKTLVDAEGAERVTVVSSTLFSNDIDEAVLWIPEDPQVEISQSIFDQNGANYVDGGDARVLCSFFDGLFPLPEGAVNPGVGVPGFRAEGDFHLTLDTPMADMCDDTTPHGAVDFDFTARPSRGGFEPGADELD